jgi:hypothetical protein
MHRSLPRTSDRPSRRLARVLACVCCLLLLLPVLSIRTLVQVQRSNLQESEESRQPTEEERSAEDPIDSRSPGRRTSEHKAHCSVAGSRGAGNCGYSAGYPHGSPFAAITRVEHQLRNGVGGPLRC